MTRCLLAALAVLATGTAAQAQQSTSPFNLSATRDFAVTGMRTATNYRYWISNAGPMDAQLGLDQISPAVLTKGSSSYAHFSEIALWAAAGQTDYTRNLAKYPALANVKNANSGGHTVSVNNHLSGTATDFLPSDGSLGIHFSGARTPATGATATACLIHSKDAIPPGMTLMAGSDCPQTWGANGWEGRGNVPFATYLSAFTTLGNAFSFDFWKQPQQTGFIGNNFQTYGFISDYNVTNNADYGNVVPGGTGAPRNEGYPLALEWQFDAFNFKDARYAGVVFWQATVTNRSTEKYGVGLDYDSLYAGFTIRTGSAYARGGAWPQQGAYVFNVLRHNTNCDNGRALPEQLVLTNFTGSCTGNSAAGIVDPGFTRGAAAVVVLKSPIGDLRNKLFSDAASPFYRPGHPLAGDTITFNVARACGLECSSTRIIGGRARSAWGVFSSHEGDALAGDQPSALPGNDYWFLFHPANAAAYADGGPRVDIANPRAGGGFNYCVPGMSPNSTKTWTYRSARPQGAPLGPDTLFIDDCNPTTQDIVPVWNDTFPDRSLKLLRGNEYIGAGPFRLAAGETQSFVIAIVMAPDSINTEAAIRNATDLYETFYSQPQPPPLPKIAAVDVDGGNVLNTNVRITIDRTSVQWVDDYLLSQANLYRTAAANTPEGRINRLNPWLKDSLTARATNNINRILVYKSCNPMAATLTYTIARNILGVCTTDIVTDTMGANKGPAAYAAITASTFAGIYTDGNVLGGQSYLYAFVPETRGAIWTIADSTASGLVTRQMVFESPIAEVPRSKSAANVVTVYVPASVVSAGGSLPDVRYSNELAGVTIDTVITPRRPTVITSWNSQSVDVMDTLPNGADMRVLTGEPVIIDIFRQAGGLTVDSTHVRIVRTRTTAFTVAGSTTLTSTATATTTTTARSTPVRTVIDTLVFKGPPDLAWAIPGPGSTQTFFTTASTAANSVTIPNGTVVINTRTNEVLYVSNTYLSGLFTPVSFAGRSNYIPLRVGLDTTSLSNTTNKGWLSRGVFDENGVRIAPNSITNPQALDWLASPSRPTNAGGGGEYAIKMAAPEFNTMDRFNLNEGAAALSQKFIDLLNSRAVGSTTLTDAATAAVVAKYLNRPLITADSLASVKLPFSITNRSFNRPVFTAILKRDTTIYRGDGRTTYRIGQGADTLRLTGLPADQWLPGDFLILMEDVPVGTTTERVVTFYPAVIGCGTGPCNPVSGTGGDANYGATPAGWEIRPRYTIPVRSGREFTVNVAPTITGAKVTNVSQAQMDSIQVVPNPYIVYSAYEQQREGSRILFTHLPPEGKIQIFTVAGQFVQQITWTPELLVGTGDLQFDLRTREGTDMASGLYLFVVTAKDPASGASRKKSGRFIIIR